MALEDLLRAHTEALIQNTEAVQLLTQSLAGRTPTKGVTGKPVVKDEIKKPDATKEEPKVESKKLEEDLAGNEQGFTPVPYADVRALVLKLAPNHRDAIKALNAKHGITKLPDLLDDLNDFATVNNQLKLEAIHDDLQALGGE